MNDEKLNVPDLVPAQTHARAGTGPGPELDAGRRRLNNRCAYPVMKFPISGNPSLRLMGGLQGIKPNPSTEMRNSHAKLALWEATKVLLVSCLETRRTCGGRFSGL